MAGRKKVLVISYYWPPSGGGGVQRWLKFSRYLPDWGWDVVIYTPEDADYPLLDPTLEADVLPETEVIRYPIFEPRKLYKKIFGEKQKVAEGPPKGPSMDELFYLDPGERSWKQNLSIWVRGNLFIPDARVLWVKPSIRFLCDYLAEHPVDVIISSGPPHSMHLIARGVKHRMGTPWVADFRDPWTEIEFYDRLMLSDRADKKHHRLERAVLKEADAVVVASGYWQEPYLQRGARRVEALTNGFDEQDFAGVPPPLSPFFLISHVGTLAYDRNPQALWDTLSSLCKEVPGFREDLRIQMVGKTDAGIFAALEAAGLGPNTLDAGYVTHAEAVSIMRESQVLLLLINQAAFNAPGRVPGKIFEYFASQRPILSIGPVEGEPARMLRETQAGVTCDFEDKAAMREALHDMYKRFREGKLQPSSKGFEQYSRKNLSRRMAKLLEEVSA